MKAIIKNIQLVKSLRAINVMLNVFAIIRTARELLNFANTNDTFRYSLNSFKCLKMPKQTWIAHFFGWTAASKRQLCILKQSVNIVNTKFWTRRKLFERICKKYMFSICDKYQTRYCSTLFEHIWYDQALKCSVNFETFWKKLHKNLCSKITRVPYA